MTNLFRTCLKTGLHQLPPAGVPGSSFTPPTVSYQQLQQLLLLLPLDRCGSSSINCTKQAVRSTCQLSVTGTNHKGLYCCFPQLGTPQPGLALANGRTSHCGSA
jgi:hypothetical protein